MLPTAGFLKKLRLRKNTLRYSLLLVIALVLMLSSVSETHANSSAKTITVISRLVVWARPSFRSVITAVLMRGRHFTVTARSPSGQWIYGITDMGMVGWIPSAGFLQLHPEVRLSVLPVLAVNFSAPMVMPRTRRMY